jgi:DNA-binding NtrC family response regulator
MEAVLMDNGYAVRSFTDPLDAVNAFRPATWDLVISDIKMPGIDGLEVLQRLKEAEPGIPVIMITAYATVEMSIQALRKGAYDMLTKPFEPDELLYRVKNALNHNQLLAENRELRQELAGKFNFGNIIGASPSLKTLLDKVEKVAIRDTSVLITGESGTGKELSSPRRSITIRRAATSGSSPSTAEPFPNRFSRANSSATRRGPSPAPPKTAWGSSRPPTAGPSFSTRSATCR